MDIKKRLKIAEKTTIVGFTVNVILAVFKLYAGIVGRSQAVIADAIESFSDIVATSVVWVGLRVSTKPNDIEHPYGHHRAETATALIVGIIILLGSFAIGGYAVNSIISGKVDTPTNVALAAAVITILVKELLYHYTIRVGRKINSMAVTANAHDHRKDALTTIATLIGVAGGRMGYPILDSIAAIVVAVIILRIGFRVSWSAINELIDIAPSSKIMEMIKKTTESVDGIECVSRFRARKTGPFMYVDIEVAMDETMTVRQSHDATEEAKKRLKEVLPDIKDIMVHVEPRNATCENEKQ